MKFIDEINIYVSSGQSGDGLFSFSNRKTPDGGNGGRGGSIYLICDNNVFTFYNLKFMSIYKAENGINGQRNKRTGRTGNDLFIKVPIGTIVYDGERNVFLGELVSHGDKLLIASSGRPGYGNAYLKRSFWDVGRLKRGSESVLRFLHLELNLLSDIGLLGFPNVGKSSFINEISNVYSKVGDYKFTTLVPILGILRNYNNRSIVLSDLPGIISFSSDGLGLGFNFLKHLLKTKLLLHFIDLSIIYNKYIFFSETFIINNELKKFDTSFLKKKKWFILSKCDLVRNVYFFSFLKFLLKRYECDFIFVISSNKKYGFKKLSFNLGEYFSKVV